MKDSARYVKIVEWSEEDHCYVGSAPGLMPPATAGRDLANRLQDVAWAATGRRDA